MIRLNKQAIGWSISLLLVAVFGWYFLAHLSDFKILLNINIWFVLILVLIYLGSIASNGLFMKYSVHLFGKKINYSEGVRVSLISTVGNFFAPAGSGLAFRAVYLKKRHGLSYGDYMSIIFCNYIIVFFINSLLGLLSLYLLRSRITPASFVLVIFFLVILLMSTFSFFIRTKEKGKSKVKQKWIAYIINTSRQISAGWTLILRSKKAAYGLVGLVILNSLLMISGTYFIMLSLGISLSLPSILLFSVLGSMSLFINITPGNFGIKEAVYIAFSSLIGLSAAQALSASLVDRLITFIVIFVLWLKYGRNLHSSMDRITSVKPKE